MSKPQIKLQRIPETKPVKFTISVMPDLEAYARVYEKAYGEKTNISELIPSMLTSFLAGDAGLKKSKRELV